MVPTSHVCTTTFILYWPAFVLQKHTGIVTDGAHCICNFDNFDDTSRQPPALLAHDAAPEECNIARGALCREQAVKRPHCCCRPVWWPLDVQHPAAPHVTISGLDVPCMACIVALHTSKPPHILRVRDHDANDV